MVTSITGAMKTISSILDVNHVSEGHDFTSVRGFAVSPDTTVLAWALDTVGRRKYTIFFKDLETGEAMSDVIPEVTGNLAWANDSQTIFYSKQDPETLRSYQIYRHRLGADPVGDELVFEETDPTYSVYVSKTRSDRFILITSSQTLATEVRTRGRVPHR
jgi:oligopeptidase B